MGEKSKTEMEGIWVYVITLKRWNWLFLQKAILKPIQIFDALHDLVALVQFEKREIHPWRSVNFSKVAG